MKNLLTAAFKFILGSSSKILQKSLTHGFKSFEKVGRDATSDELLEIQKRVICYLRGILENIESYLSNEKYLKVNVENSENS